MRMDPSLFEVSLDTRLRRPSGCEFLKEFFLHFEPVNRNVLLINYHFLPILFQEENRFPDNE